MKEITLSKDGSKIKVAASDRSTSYIQVESKTIEEKNAALLRAEIFLAKNSESIQNLLGGGVAEELELLSNPDFLPMIKSLKHAGISKVPFFETIHETILKSQNSPEEPLATLLAKNYTDFVYGRVKGLGKIIFVVG